MVRNSTKFVSYKDLKTICADLKAIYTAVSEATGREALEDFGSKWNARYPMIYRSWSSRREDINEFFNYPPEIRKASTKWTMPIRDWGMALNQFAIYFGDRVQFN